jgi:hypothetical protein
MIGCVNSCSICHSLLMFSGRKDGAEEGGAVEDEQKPRNEEVIMGILLGLQVSVTQLTRSAEASNAMLLGLTTAPKPERTSTASPTCFTPTGLSRATAERVGMAATSGFE